MLERAFKLKEAIDELCFREQLTDRLTSVEWELVNQTCECLKIFAQFTTFVQGSNVSIATVIPTVK